MLWFYMKSDREFPACEHGVLEQDGGGEGNLRMSLARSDSGESIFFSRKAAIRLAIGFEYRYPLRCPMNYDVCISDQLRRLVSGPSMGAQPAKNS